MAKQWGGEGRRRGRSDGDYPVAMSLLSYKKRICSGGKMTN